MDFSWIFYNIESPDRNIGAWHDSITSQILARINTGVQYIRYTSEYIPKLEIHQHSLLNWKVFSRHNLYSQVFFYVSSSIHLHLQVIKSVSSLYLDHHWIIIESRSSLDLEHHWIIIKSRSSLDLNSQCWIITRSSSLVLSQFYSSQEVLQSHPFFMLVSCWL